MSKWCYLLAYWQKTRWTELESLFAEIFKEYFCAPNLVNGQKMGRDPEVCRRNTTQVCPPIKIQWNKGDGPKILTQKPCTSYLEVQSLWMAQISSDQRFKSSILVPIPSARSCASSFLLKEQFWTLQRLRWQSCEDAKVAVDIRRSALNKKYTQFCSGVTVSFAFVSKLLGFPFVSKDLNPLICKLNLEPHFTVRSFRIYNRRRRHSGRRL